MSSAEVSAFLDPAGAIAQAPQAGAEHAELGEALEVDRAAPEVPHEEVGGEVAALRAADTDERDRKLRVSSSSQTTSQPVSCMPGMA
jgi:hypothetical protein